jgi:hypothetical protein
MENPAQINEKDFPSRLMSLGETEAELGTYRLFSHDHEEARAAIEQALHEDSGLALAHETLGFLDLKTARTKPRRPNSKKHTPRTRNAICPFTTPPCCLRFENRMHLPTN